MEHINHVGFGNEIIDDNGNIIAFERSESEKMFKYTGIVNIAGDNNICYLKENLFKDNDRISFTNAMEYSKTTACTLNQMRHDLGIYLHDEYWYLLQKTRKEDKNNIIDYCLEYAFDTLNGMDFGLHIASIGWTEILEDLICGCVYAI